MGSQLDLNPGTRGLSFVTMTYFRQFSLQNDSVSSSSDASLYVDTFNTDSESRVTSTSESSSSESSVNSENLANQLRESPWVTSTTTEENVYTTNNQSMTNLIKNNNNTNSTNNNADLCLFKVSYILQGGK